MTPPPPGSGIYCQGFSSGQKTTEEETEGNLRKKWEKLQENEKRLRKCSYLAHPGVTGWLQPCPRAQVTTSFMNKYQWKKYDNILELNEESSEHLMDNLATEFMHLDLIRPISFGIGKRVIKLITLFTGFFVNAESLVDKSSPTKKNTFSWNAAIKW